MSDKEITVHKSSIALMTGESLGAFSMAVRDAAESHMRKSMSLGKDDYMYTSEAFGDMVVMEVSGRVNGVHKTRYWSLPYKRENGVFTFAKATEVRRVTTFLPNTPAVVDTTKAMDGEEADVAKARASWQPFWSGVNL